MRSRLQSFLTLALALLIISAALLPAQSSLGNANSHAARKDRDPHSALSRSGSSGDSGNADNSGLFLPRRNADSPSLSNVLSSSPQLPAGVDAITYAGEPVLPGEYNGDVRKLPQVPASLRADFEPREPQSSKKQTAAQAALESADPNVPLAAMPAPIQNFAGLSKTDAVTGGTAGAGWPPDINGDVGPNHYIEAVNDAWAIYSKTGTLLSAFTENSLWASAASGTPCDSNNQGDPVVVYDQFADRWILTNFAFAVSAGNPVAPFYQCFAVSKTSDPVAGGYWLYAVRMDPGTAGTPPNGALNDYGKFGNWNDGCLYMGANEFNYAAGSGAFLGTAFASFNKGDMESGTALTFALGYIANTTNPFTLIPSNITGAKGSTKVPPSGTPNYFVSESQTLFDYEVRKFTPGNSPKQCGGGGSLGAAALVTQTSYSIGGTDVAQPAPATAANLLDTLSDRIMQKVQYRRLAAVESLWVTHTVRTTVSAVTTDKPQWAQINVSGGTVVTTPVQQQIYAPENTINRWMPAIAADGQGNVALGYSTSNGTSPNFPSIAYSGRLVGDALNQLPQTETQLVAGLGSQVNNCGGAPCHRWGDYTSMSVDPVDDCTFWYTNEYYDSQTSGTSGNWHTRIGSFKFPTCTAIPTAADSRISGQVLSATGEPVAGVSVTLSGSQSRVAITDAQGNYSFANVETGGFYNVAPALDGYSFAPAERSFSVNANVTDAVFTATRQTAIVPNLIEGSGYFVRQHYLDFLGREPDEAGFSFWNSQLTSCGNDAACLEARHVNVSAAYFLSIEFQQTGGLVDGLYRASFDCPPQYAEFMPDAATVAKDVVVGRSGWEERLAANKQAFLDAFVARPGFQSVYGGLSNSQYVDQLLTNTRIIWSQGERDALVNGLASGAQTRAVVLGQIAGDQRFVDARHNQMFVMMEYFGYLRRDPDASGYQFWLNKLNQFNGNFEQAEMVKAFIISGEYRDRFPR